MAMATAQSAAASDVPAPVPSGDPSAEPLRGPEAAEDPAPVVAPPRLGRASATTGTPITEQVCAAEPSLFGPRSNDAEVAAALMDGVLTMSPHASVTIPADPSWGEVLVQQSNWEVKYQALVWLDVLRRQYLVTGDTALLDRYTFLVRDFVTDNALRDQPRSPWTWYDHPTGQRASFLACATTVLGTPDWLLTAMELHRVQLSDPTQYKGYGNHSLMQNSGLLSLGCTLDIPDARDLALARGQALLAKAVDAQGVIDEGSYAYQWSNYVWWSEYGSKVTACGMSLPPDFPRIALMPQFLADATAPSGLGTPFGDSIPGVRVPSLVTQPPSGLTSIYDRGYAFSRSGWGLTRPLEQESMLSLRFGQSYNDQPHGHMDAGNLGLEAYGTPLLADSGMYAYGGAFWRSYVKSAAAHNVVTIAGAAYRRDQLSPLKYTTSNDRYAMFSMQSDVISGATWRRTVLHSKRGNWFLVDDQVTASKSGLITQRWNLPDGAQYATIQGKAVLQQSEGVGVSIRFLGGTPDLRIREGWKSPDKPYTMGWRSYTYGTIEPSPTLEARKRAASWHVVTLISARGGEAGSGISLSDVSVSNSGVNVTVKSLGASEAVSLLPYQLRARDIE